MTSKIFVLLAFSGSSAFALDVMEHSVETSLSSTFDEALDESASPVAPTLQKDGKKGGNKAKKGGSGKSGNKNKNKSKSGNKNKNKSKSGNKNKNKSKSGNKPKDKAEKRTPRPRQSLPKNTSTPRVLQKQKLTETGSSKPASPPNSKSNERRPSPTVDRPIDNNRRNQLEDQRNQRVEKERQRREAEKQRKKEAARKAARHENRESNRSTKSGKRGEAHRDSKNGAHHRGSGHHAGNRHGGAHGAHYRWHHGWHYHHRRPLRWYHGRFVYGPRPYHHGRVRRGYYTESVPMPARQIDRNGAFSMGLTSGGYRSGYSLGGEYKDFGLGINVRYRPVEGLGFEFGYSYHDDTFEADTERITRMFQPSVQVFLAPWTRISPYATVGVTFAEREYDDLWTDGFDNYQTKIYNQSFGPHAGIGLEIALGQNAAIDLESRVIGYLDTQEGDTLPGAIQSTFGVQWYF